MSEAPKEDAPANEAGGKASAPPKPLNPTHVWVAIAMVGALSVWSLINSYQASKQADEQSMELATVYLDYLMREARYRVDFTVPQVQDIGNGFYLVRSEQEEHLTGLKYKGRIINSTSVRHNNVEFKLVVGGQEKEFTINQISAGNSTAFEVYVPDVTAEAGRYGEIKYQQSSIAYYIR